MVNNIIISLQEVLRITNKIIRKKRADCGGRVREPTPSWCLAAETTSGVSADTTLAQILKISSHFSNFSSMIMWQSTNPDSMRNCGNTLRPQNYNVT